MAEVTTKTLVCRRFDLFAGKPVNLESRYMHSRQSMLTSAKLSFNKLIRGFLLCSTLGLAGLSFAQSSSPNAPQPPLPTIKVKAGMFIVTAEVAKEPAERSMGLMFRQTMEPDHGMLFVFDRADLHCFWMRNTLLPLSIAWLTEDGTIVSIADMTPKSETNNCPTGVAKYALEMNQGWFKKKGLKAGSKLKAPPLFGN
jgi:uncharacterized protein